MFDIIYSLYSVPISIKLSTLLEKKDKAQVVTKLILLIVE